MHGTALDIEAKAIRHRRDEAIKMNRRACEAMTRYHPERDILPKLKAELARRKPIAAPPRPRKTSWSVSHYAAWQTFPGYGGCLVATQLPPRRMASDILKEVARAHKVGVADLLGPHRFRHLVKARQKIAYRIASETKLSLPQIGKVLGGRDHTTIIHAVRAYCKAHGLEPPRGMGWGNKFMGRPRNVHKALEAA